MRLLVGFDLLFTFGVLACQILECASLLCGLLSGKMHCLLLKLELLDLAKAYRYVHFLRLLRELSFTLIEE